MDAEFFTVLFKKKILYAPFTNVTIICLEIYTDYVSCKDKIARDWEKIPILGRFLPLPSTPSVIVFSSLWL